MNLYTFYNDFRGKQYINQIQSETNIDAAILWAKKLNINNIKYINNYTKLQILHEIKEEIKEKLMIPLEQTQNLWNLTYRVKTGFGFVDFIKTSETNEYEKSNLYTLIMDFREGTYFYQHIAKNELQVIEKWANELNINEIQTVGKKSKQLLKINISNLQKELYKVENTKNVWRFSYKFKTGHAVVYIIKTYWSL